MYLDEIINFFKWSGFYEKEIFDHILKQIKVINKPYHEIKDFVGCYPISNDLLDFKIVLPQLNNINDALIYVHEISHALFVDDDSEIFPNLMEAIYLKDYLNNQELIDNTIKTNNYNGLDFNHQIGNKVKIMYLKK